MSKKRHFIRDLQRFFKSKNQIVLCILNLLYYNKDNLGGFPMQKIKVHVDIILTIILGFFFVLAAALFFALPFIDAAVVPSAVDGMLPYNPWLQFAAGAVALVSFNFASLKYLIIMISGVVIGIALIVWLVAIIVGKKPRKLFLWGILAHLAILIAILISAYSLPVCREVFVEGEAEPLAQYIFLDCFGEYDGYILDAAHYEAEGLWVAEFAELFVNEDGVVEVPAFLMNGGITHIFSIVGFVSIGVFALLALFIPIFSSVFLFLAKRPAVEETEEERLAREKAEEARRLRQERYLTYVEYEAGKSSRDKEYIELCRAHGLPIPADLKEAEENAYYAELSKDLPVLNGEPIEDPDELYYSELKKSLPVFTGEVIENPDDAYYEDLKRRLPVFTGEVIEDPREAYYAELKRDLPVLNGEPIEDKDELYYEELKKELVGLHPDKLESNADYIERLSKELPLLKNRGESVEKGESKEEYIARLSKELPVLQQEQEIHIGKGESQREYNSRLEKELALFHQDREAEIEEQIRNLRRSEANKKAYYQKMKESLPCLNESAKAED